MDFKENNPDVEGELGRARETLKGLRGGQFWERLEELAEERGFQKMLQRLVPGIGWQQCSAMDRRHFLQMMGAALGMAGLSACTKQPPEAIVPYINQPEALADPGKPLFYTSAMALGGAAYGVVVRSNMGRPTKIDGNPKHPSSLGATDPFGQAEILRLYDPDRSQTVLQFGKVSSWDSFYLTLVSELSAKQAAKGQGLRLLTSGVISPTLARVIQEFLQLYPAARWHRWEPVNLDRVRAGARLALGADLQPVYAMEKAAVIVSLDSDFLMWEPGRLRYARDFSNGRRVRAGHAEMNRLYVAEGPLTITGAVADHRLPLRPSQVEMLARALAARVGMKIPGGGMTELSPDQNRWLEAAASDLNRHRGAGLVLAGAGQPPAVHALAYAINQALGNIGKTVQFIAPLEAGPADAAASLRELTADMNGGKVDLLIVMGGNPAYDAPADVPFAEAMQKVRLRIRHGLYEDETSLLCQWHLPEAHFLESWGDVLGHDGAAAIVQPLILPMYAGRPAVELAAMLMGQSAPSAYQLVRDTWRARLGGNFERSWRAALVEGVIAGTAAPARPVTVNLGALGRGPQGPGAKPAGLELIFRPDYAVWDGRYANNSWLQELPRPLTKIMWDNVALMSPATAERLGVGTMDVVELSCRGRTVRAPAWIEWGHADDCVTVDLGYGRAYAGKIGTKVGFNAYAVRSAETPWFDGGVQVRRTGDRIDVVTRQIYRTQDGRNLVKHAAIGEFGKEAHAAGGGHGGGEHASLYPQYPYEAPVWGMMIDLSTCIGCNACVVACQAENNIPTVGKRQARMDRAMHWLRIDRYYEGDVANPQVLFAPIPCMHCETAPCEVVCPVAATVHSGDGLNEMVYNRCVGTRYCSNNCPYKVRRFNFLEYNDHETVVLKMARNPDVTVRSRGVMEKCTYCVQRIWAARIAAAKEGRLARDGDVTTACQDACPTRTIVFGDLSDKKSAVAAMAAQPHAYAILGHLNTQPRTRYLTALENPHPELKKA